MILRLRQICAHPYLVLVRPPFSSSLAPLLHSLTRLLICGSPATQHETDDFADPTALLGSDGDKELARATKLVGAKWVNMVRYQPYVPFSNSCD